MEYFIVAIRMKDDSIDEYKHSLINRKKLRDWFRILKKFREDRYSTIHSLEHLK